MSSTDEVLVVPSSMPSPVPPRHPRSALAKWLLVRRVSTTRPEAEEAHEPQSWRKIMCLTGVDCFSSLAYIPGIVALAAGAISSLATQRFAAGRSRRVVTHVDRFHPSGEVLGRLGPEPGRLDCSFDLAELRELRRRFPLSRHPCARRARRARPVSVTTRSSPSPTARPTSTGSSSKGTMSRPSDGHMPSPIH